MRCDLNVTGDYLFFQEVTRTVDGTVETKENVARSLLVSYIQGASEIYKVREGCVCVCVCARRVLFLSTGD